jgi:nucleoside-diphosphate-sugar epimerase
MRFTVIGAGGFIGSRLCERLEARGDEVFRPGRLSADLYQESGLGHVIYAAGVTADFRNRPFDTLRANTSHLADVLESSHFESLTYLSTTRIYRHAEHTREDAAIFVRPADGEDLYDLTKLTAESLCNISLKANVRVVRLSNVVGPDFVSDNFLATLIRSACERKSIHLRTGLESEKDYVLLDDVIELIPRIAVCGGHRCYNLASGRNTKHREVVGSIVARSDARLSVDINAPTVMSASISIERLQGEFDYQPSATLDYISRLVDQYRNRT